MLHTKPMSHTSTLLLQGPSDLFQAVLYIFISTSTQKDLAERLFFFIYKACHLHLLQKHMCLTLVAFCNKYSRQYQSLQNPKATNLLATARNYHETVLCLIRRTITACGIYSVMSQFIYYRFFDESSFQINIPQCRTIALRQVSELDKRQPQLCLENIFTSLRS